MIPASKLNVIELPKTLKTVACDKCGREITVGKNTVLAFCRECSARMCEKR